MNRTIFIIFCCAAAFAQNAPPRSPAPRSAAPPAARTSGVPSYKELKYPPLRKVQIPNVETSTLPNGMKLYLLEDHELPLVRGTALVRTGNLFDPADEVGLATLTGMVMRTGGTKSKTGDQLDEELENVASTVESSIDESMGTVSFSALKANTGEALGVFKDVLTQPDFRQDKIDLAKAQLRSAISRRNDNAATVSQREFLATLYGRNTSYGWDMQYATVDRITRDDVVNFYRRYFFPANIMLAVYGDFDSPAMKAEIGKLFADFTVQQPPVPPFPKVAPPPPGGTYLGVKNDVTQTFFAIGQLDGEYRDKDYPALEILGTILGGGFQSRLVERVRTRMGNAYNISADWSPQYDHPGTFEIAGSTKSLSTLDTMKAIRDEVDRIRASEVSEAELKTAKETALNSFVFAFDTTAKTLVRMLIYEYYGYPKDFMQQYQAGLEAVTRADVLRVAKEHLDPAKFVTIVIGNPQDFGKPLESLGQPVTKLDLTIPPPPEPAPKASSGSSLEQGQKMLARVQQAVGGAEKLAHVKDLTTVSKYEVAGPSGAMQLKETDRWIAPSHIRQESEMAGRRLVAYWDGKSGWFAQGQRSAPLTGDQISQLKIDLFRTYFPLLLSDRLEGRTVNAIGENTLEISEKGINPVRLVIDPATGLPSKMLYQTVRASGPPLSVEEDYSDFRDVSGIRMPFKVTMFQGGRKFADLAVMEIHLNSGLQPEDLRRRP
jgi:zinc protease